MKMTRMVFLVAMALASCSTTPKDLERSKSAKTETFTDSENYQQIFKRIYDSGKACNEGGIAFSLNASMSVDGQLYSDLGFGEVTLSLINVGVRNYYWKAKVEKQGSGSKLTIVSGNTSSNGLTLRKVKSWADGKEGCSSRFMKNQEVLTRLLENQIFRICVSKFRKSASRYTRKSHPLKGGHNHL